MLLPEIREEFGLNLTGVLGIVAVVGAAALALQVPIAQLADRSSRTRLTLIGAAAWAVFLPPLSAAGWTSCSAVSWTS